MCKLSGRVLQNPSLSPHKLDNLVLGILNLNNAQTSTPLKPHLFLFFSCSIVTSVTFAPCVRQPVHQVSWFTFKVQGRDGPYLPPGLLRLQLPAFHTVRLAAWGWGELQCIIGRPMHGTPLVQGVHYTSMVMMVDKEDPSGFKFLLNHDVHAVSWVSHHLSTPSVKVRKQKNKKSLFMPSCAPPKEVCVQFSNKPSNVSS